jgi:hypothetical protein
MIAARGKLALNQAELCYELEPSQRSHAGDSIL